MNDDQSGKSRLKSFSLASRVKERKPAVPEPTDAQHIGSVRTFLDALEKIARPSESILFYRGHSNFAYKLRPLIYRNDGWIENEDILFKELILRCPNDFSHQESTFQTLVKMQHYCLPTRLLDLTTNPLVALLFACTEGEDKRQSGEVLVFQVPKKEVKYFDSDTVSVIANISRRPASFSVPTPIKPDPGTYKSEVERDSLIIESFNEEDDIEYLLHEIKHEKPYFKHLIKPAHLESVVCVKPKMDNPRIIRQDGAFFLFGVSGTKLQPAMVPTKYLVSTGENRILIRANAKKKHFIPQLEALGITMGTVYPEIDRVAEFIKKSYERIA
jgi:hypothetical protein